jgi:dihydroorotate dehydrogenase electron transfer subunit
MSDRTPLHVHGEILASKRMGAYRLLTVHAPGIPERTRPGTFVAVSVPEPALARRALWVYRVRPTGGYGPTLELLVEPRGTGTRWLAGAAPGTPLEVTGPLGRAWALPKEPAPALVVGEGYAAAALFGLAERLRERDCPVTMLLAAQDEAHLVSALEARRSARSVTVVTGDGSVGRRGTLTDVIEETIRSAGPAIVYAAAPPRTLAAVSAVAEEAGAWSQVAVETPTPCGTGLCHGCGVPVLGEDGIGRVVRGCTEGPVFRGDRVRWAELDHA